MKVHPKSRREEIVRRSEKEFEVWVREAPEKGRANEAVREALGGYFGVSKSRVAVVSGAASRKKIVEVSH